MKPFGFREETSRVKVVEKQETDQGKGTPSMVSPLAFLYSKGVSGVLAEDNKLTLSSSQFFPICNELIVYER